MEALRIELSQSSANYKKEEVVQNKMTYPLPPFSTIIGALHNACGFLEYHPMDISIQGKYGALGKRAYIDHCYLNSTQDDRGKLVRMDSKDALSKAFTCAGYAMKAQGNSFRKQETIMKVDENTFNSYLELKDEADRYDKCLSMIKNRLKYLKKKKEKFKNDIYIQDIIKKRECELKQAEKDVRSKKNIYCDEPIANFKTLTTSLKFYEILYDVELVIHVKSDKETLNTIIEHIYELKSLGRSEDFVEVKFASIVELKEPDDEYCSEYSAYIDADLVDKKNSIYLDKKTKGAHAQGTKYFINKNYSFENADKKEKRIFQKKKVYYTSKYEIDEDSDDVFIDSSGEKDLIVNFL